MASIFFLVRNRPHPLLARRTFTTRGCVGRRRGRKAGMDGPNFSPFRFSFCFPSRLAGGGGGWAGRMEKRRGGKEEWEMLIHMRATTTPQHRHTLARVPGPSLPPSLPGSVYVTWKKREGQVACVEPLPDAHCGGLAHMFPWAISLSLLPTSPLFASPSPIALPCKASQGRKERP